MMRYVLSKFEVQTTEPAVTAAYSNSLDSKVHGANMGSTWVLSSPGGPMLAPWTLLSGRNGKQTVTPTA